MGAGERRECSQGPPFLFKRAVKEKEYLIDEDPAFVHLIQREDDAGQILAVRGQLVEIADPLRRL